MSFAVGPALSSISRRLLSAAEIHGSAPQLLLIGVIKPVRFVLCPPPPLPCPCPPLSSRSLFVFLTVWTDCIAQIVGAIVASAILEGLLPGPLAVTPGLGAGTNRAQGVWSE